VESEFDYTINDSQGTGVDPIDPKNFEIEQYRDYEAQLQEENERFWNAEEGVQVYRRFRIPEVFSSACADMEYSLSLQLAGLQKSIEYKADVANFLEPWYGIGTAASAFGVDYVWKEGQAPATEPPFSSVQEALEYEPVPIESTGIGMHTLEMIEFFLDRTKGKLPISLTDTQSPFNVASYLIETNAYYISVIDSPEDLKKLVDRIADLNIEFTKKQIELIGDALVYPGHGFSSSRKFDGIGMSDDNMMMLSPEQYREIEVPANSKFGNAFGGPVFHSCGNWSQKIDAVQEMDNLLMVDGAFSMKTDPDPNPAAPFSEAFASTGTVLNARIVGGKETIMEQVRELWKAGMKLIVVTYCKTPEEQEDVYNAIHRHCGV
jgi:uroporphyrinogen-III decarboxylase